MKSCLDSKENLNLMGHKVDTCFLTIAYLGSWSGGYWYFHLNTPYDTLETFLELLQQREILDGSWSYVVVLTTAFVWEEGGGEFSMELMTRYLDRSG